MNTPLFESFAAHTPPVTHVFVYGTLRRGDDNDITRLLPAPRLVGHAHVAGTLHHLGAYPGIVLGGPGRVLGEVYAITPALEATLDEIECLPPSARTNTSSERSISTCNCRAVQSSASAASATNTTGRGSAKPR